MRLLPERLPSGAMTRLSDVLIREAVEREAGVLVRRNACHRLSTRSSKSS
jgi:hypothetical protein